MEQPQCLIGKMVCKQKSKLNCNAKYVHSYKHCLSLTLVDSLENKNCIVFDFFGYIQLMQNSFVEGSHYCLTNTF